jgi:hypothetical protein
VIPAAATAVTIKQRLIALGIEFVETHRTRNHPITEQSALTVVYDINVDETIVRAACKIAFNYAAKVLGPETLRDARYRRTRSFAGCLMVRGTANGK